MNVFIAHISDLTFLKKSKYDLLKVDSLNKRRTEEKSLSYSLLNYALDIFYNLSPKEIIKSEHGKPYLKDSNIFFNLSHSKDLIVLSLSNYENGIDLEIVKDRARLDLLAKKVFDDDLFNIYLQKANTIDKINFFIHMWTIKECVVKQSGLGLISLSSVLILDSLKEIKAKDSNKGYVMSYLLEKKDFNNTFYMSLFTKDKDINIYKIKNSNFNLIDLKLESLYKLN